MQCLLLTTQPDCIYKTLAEKRLTNLQHHFYRMRALHYPDWGDIMDGKDKIVGRESPKEAEAKKQDPPPKKGK